MSAKITSDTSILYIRDQTIKEITEVRSQMRQGKDTNKWTSSNCYVVLLYLLFVPEPSLQFSKSQKVNNFWKL